MTIEIRIRDVLGVEEAEFKVDRIALVAGNNYAGKSSLLQAIGAAATGKAGIRGLDKKNEGGKIVRDGANRGFVTIANGSGDSCKVVYPGMDVETKGRPVFGSPLGIGTVRFSSLSVQARTTELVERIGARPTIEDLETFLKDRELDQADVIAAHTWKGLEDTDGDWDAVHQAAKDELSRTKGRWEQLAETRWGSSKYKTWAPSRIDPDRVKPEQWYADQLSGALTDLEEAMATAAISEERLSEIRAIAARAPALEAELQAARADLEARHAEHVAAIKERDALPPAWDTATLPACPHCQQRIYVRIVGGLYSLDKAEEPLSNGEYATRKKAIDDNAARIQNRREAYEAAERKRTQIDMSLAQARQAAEKIPELEARATGGTDIERARKAADEAKALKAAYDQWKKAGGIAAEIDRLLPIVDALAPAGVRQEKLSRMLSEFNAELAELSKILGLPTATPVSVDSGGDTYLGERPFEILSESEQYRVDIAVQAAFARREQAKLLLIDRLDVLQANARGCVMNLVRHLGLPAVITMTQDNPSKVPKLAQYDMGETYWIRSGVVERLD